MAIRQVLKMIEKREVALAKRNKSAGQKITMEHEQSSDNAREALVVLGILEAEPGVDIKVENRWRVATWAAQAGLSRPGKRKLKTKDVSDIKFFTMDSEELRWPRGNGV